MSLHLSQSEFGAKIGCSQTTIAGYETGARSPSSAVIKSILREFDVTPQWLMDGTEPKWPQRTRSDELAAFFGELTKDPDGSFRASLICELAKLDLEAWQALEAFCRRVLDRDSQNQGEKKED